MYVIFKDKVQANSATS